MARPWLGHSGFQEFVAHTMSRATLVVLDKIRASRVLVRMSHFDFNLVEDNLSDSPRQCTLRFSAIARKD